MQRRKRKPSKIERHAAKMAMKCALHVARLMRERGDTYFARMWIMGYRDGVRNMLDSLRQARICSRWDTITKAVAAISDTNWKPTTTRRRKCRRRRRPNS